MAARVTVLMVAEKPMLADSIAKLLSDKRASKRKGLVLDHRVLWFILQDLIMHVQSANTMHNFMDMLHILKWRVRVDMWIHSIFRHDLIIGNIRIPSICSKCQPKRKKRHRNCECARFVDQWRVRGTWRPEAIPYFFFPHLPTSVCCQFSLTPSFDPCTAVLKPWLHWFPSYTATASMADSFLSSKRWEFGNFCNGTQLAFTKFCRRAGVYDRETTMFLFCFVSMFECRRWSSISMSKYDNIAQWNIS